MEGRWAQLTLSALYDKALDLSEISRDDGASLIKEHLIHEEAARRRSYEYLKIKAVVCAGGNLGVEARNELLLSVLEDTGKKTIPWAIDVEPDEQAAEDDIEDYYHRVMAAFKEQKAEMKKLLGDSSEQSDNVDRRSDKNSIRGLF